MNVLVMYDRQTGSLWSQILGEAIEGEMQGASLDFFPSWMTTWSDWTTRHPDTLALDKGFRGGRDPYTNYYQSGQAGVIGETFQDDRLYTKQFVIGVEIDNQPVAFPFSVLNEEPVVNTEIADTPVLVVFNPETATGVVFKRAVDGQTLTFQKSNEGTLVDAETGSSWSEFEGVALEGPLQGTSLERVKSTSSFWFGWKDFYPNTAVYGVEE